MHFDYPKQYLTVDDLTVRYWDQGQGEALLLIHGMGACLEVWAWNMDALSAQHRVIALDLPGSGKSSRPVRDDVFSMHYAGGFLARFAVRLGISTFSVAGNSMGGILAIQLALAYPDLVRRLILVDSGGLGKEVHWAVRLVTLPLLDQMLVRPPRSLVRLAAQHMMLRHDTSAEELIERVAAYFLVAGTGPTLLKMARSGVDLQGQLTPYSAAELGRIQAPTLVIWGEADPVIPVGHAEIALHAIRDCRAVVIDQAGHGPQIDRPEVFNNLVIQFLSTGPLAREETPDKAILHL